MKVIYWTNIPTPYTNGRFSAVAAAGEVDLSVLYRRRTESDRHWEIEPASMNFQYHLPSEVSLNSSDELSKLVARVRPDIVVGALNDFDSVRGIVGALVRGVPIALRVLPTYRSWFRRSPVREAVKHGIYRSVAGAKVGNADAFDQCLRYGMSASRVVPVVQSANRLIGETPKPTVDRSGSLKMGFIGRLTREKGFDIALDCLRLLRASGRNWELLVWGAGPLAARLPQEGVTYNGFLDRSEILEAYSEFDVLVFPTRGDPHGLVVDEALVSGVPVVSSAAAGGISTRVVNGYNGLVGSIASGQDLATLVTAFEPVIRREKDLRSRCIDSVVGRSHEDYARDFSRFIEHIAPLGNATKIW